jgi:3D (Asp-Asp-Asp) domain-containing protein
MKTKTKTVFKTFRIKGLQTNLVLSSLIITFLLPHYSWAYFGAGNDAVLAMNYNYTPIALNAETEKTASDLTIFRGNSLIAENNPIVPEKIGPACPVEKTYNTCPVPVNKRFATITAYSSTVGQTDSSPFTTASGTTVRDGIVAANFLKIGTKVQIPQLYGDKIFTVEDRMAKKNNGKVDIWMPSTAQALQFGVKHAEVVVLEN